MCKRWGKRETARESQEKGKRITGNAAEAWFILRGRAFIGGVGRLEMRSACRLRGRVALCATYDTRLLECTSHRSSGAVILIKCMKRFCHES